MSVLRVPTECLIVLAGPSASGKSAWAAKHFRPEQIVSSDELRARVGTSERDIRASEPAFSLLDQVVGERVMRGLLTVIDTLGMDDDRRRKWIEMGHSSSIPVIAVVFDETLDECKKRNRRRRHPVPQKVLTQQHRRWREVRPLIDQEGFDAVVEPWPVRVVPPEMIEAVAARQRQIDNRVALEFGLQISNFTFDGSPESTRTKLAEIAGAAEDAGFTSLWVMDHFRQIPQVGREWDDMLESYTTLGFLAGVSSNIRLGTLVTGVGYRNPAHLGKIVSTLDVLSGGRAVCGLGIGWFEKEAVGYGWEFPPVVERYDLLRDVVELLRHMWGPGNKAFHGKVVDAPDPMSYPRPLQERIPILIGGSGERTTLRLVAEHADMANLFGDPDTIRHKVEVLHRHCADVGRDPAEIAVTHLGPAMIAPTPELLARTLDRHIDGTTNTTSEMLAERLAAGTVEDHIGRYRIYADAGVDAAIVSLTDVEDIEPVALFAEVIAAFD